MKFHPNITLNRPPGGKSALGSALTVFCAGGQNALKSVYSAPGFLRSDVSAGLQRSLHGALHALHKAKFLVDVVLGVRPGVPGGFFTLISKLWAAVPVARDQSGLVWKLSLSGGGRPVICPDTC